MYNKFSSMYLEDLKDYRLMTGLSQVDFAAKCHLKLSLIQRIEQGYKDILDLSVGQFNCILSCLCGFDKDLAAKFVDTFLCSYAGYGCFYNFD